MWTTSIPMHAASASASDCTGDTPAVPALSSTIDTSPERPSKMRSRAQTSSTVVGAFGAMLRWSRSFRLQAEFVRLILRGSETLAALEQRADREPSERQRDE